MSVTDIAKWRRRRGATSRRFDLNDTVSCGCGARHFVLRAAHSPDGEVVGCNVKKHHDGSVIGYTGVLHCTACGKTLDGE